MRVVGALMPGGRVRIRLCTLALVCQPLETEKRRFVPSIPFSSCTPRSSNRRPEPATTSLTVSDTSTSLPGRLRHHPCGQVDCDPAEGAVPLENLADVNAGTDPDAELARGLTL